MESMQSIYTHQQPLLYSAQRPYSTCSTQLPGTVDDKVAEVDDRGTGESSPQPVRRLRGGKVTGLKETGGKTTGAKQTGGSEGEGSKKKREWGGKATVLRETGANATSAQENQETGGKGDTLMGEREMDNTLPGDKTAAQNATEVIQHKNYTEVVIEGGDEEGEGVCGGLHG